MTDSSAYFVAIHDPVRLSTLDSYDILDTAPEQTFDDIVQLATLACDAPVALVSLVAGDRQWFKARIGFPHSQTDLNRSVCAHALDEPDLLVIPDLLADPRTRGNPLVMGEPFIRFYAGAPLRDGDDQVLGNLCVIDTTPRPEGLSLVQGDMLRNMARQVMTLIKLRRCVVGRDRFIADQYQAEKRIGREHARLRSSEAYWRGLFERLSEGLIIGEIVRDDAGRAVDWRYLDVNPAWGELMGRNVRDVVGRTVCEMFPGIKDEWVQEFAQVVETGEAASFSRRVDLLDRWYEGRVFPLENDKFTALFLDVTSRVQGDLHRGALLEIGDRLRDLTTVEEMTRVTAAIVGRTLGVSRAGFGRLEEDGRHVVIEPDWTAEGMSSIAGRHRFGNYGDVGDEILSGQPLIVRDTLTDPRTVPERDRWIAVRIRAAVNIPIRERGRTMAMFLVHDVRPRDWTPATLAFLRNVGDRLATGVARLEAEERQAVLNQELSHRMKNMLAMVQAVATQTLKGVTEQEAVTAFHHRLRALSSAHNVLLQTSWTSTQLDQVVTAVLGQSCRMAQVGIDGPAITLGPRATLSVSLMLHELATNAVKYGALSVPTGQVGVRWRVETATDELVFDWSETGGPPAVEPTRRGFGSKLLRGGLIGTGGVELRYLSAGLRAEMRASMEHIQAR